MSTPARHLRRQRPIWPSVASRIERAQQEAERAPLWEMPQQGRPLTPGNVLSDAGDVVRQLNDDPANVLPRLRDRLKSYLSRGPDINQPVPLTDQPFDTRTMDMQQRWTMRRRGLRQ